MPTTKSPFRLLWIAPVAILVVGGIGVAAMMQPPPADLDLSLSKPTDAGLYVSSLAPQLEPLAVGPIHSWTVEVTMPDGTPVEDAEVRIDGGMPQHGHGLPTKPQVTEKLGGGRYLVEGMKFNMPGWWTIDVDVDGPAGHDQVTFNITL